MNENPGGTPNPLNPNPGTGAEKYRDANYQPSEYDAASEYVAGADEYGDGYVEYGYSDEYADGEYAGGEYSAGEYESISAENYEPQPAQQYEPVARPAAPRVVDPMIRQVRRPAQNTMPIGGAMPEDLPPRDMGYEDSVSGAGQDTLQENLTQENLTANTNKPSDVASKEAILTMESAEDMEPSTKGSVVEKAGPKKPRVWVGILIGIVIAAIIAGVATVLALTMLKPADAVPAAVSKLISENRPKYLALKGKVNIVNNNSATEPAKMVIDFDSAFDSKTLGNFVTAEVTATLKDGSKFEFVADEVRTDDGDLYLRLDGVSDGIKKLYGTATNCAEGNTNCAAGATSTSTQMLNSAFEVIDGEWIRIPGSDFSVTNNLIEVDNTAQCLIGALGNLSSYNGNIAALYQANPFVNYSTDNVGIAKKANTLYHLAIDEQALTNFANAMRGNGFKNELIACMGGKATNQDLTVAEVTAIAKKFPDVYVEIDGQNNFTRVYLTAASEDGLTRATADLDLIYPTSINLETPTEYMDINLAMQKVLSTFTGANFNPMEGLEIPTNFNPMERLKIPAN